MKKSLTFLTWYPTQIAPAVLSLVPKMVFSTAHSVYQPESQVARNHVAHLLGDAPQGVLAGRPGADRPDPGAIVCACFDVGVNTILAAIAEQKLLSVEAIGAALNAGTNCGSCRPELAALLASATVQEAAE